MSKKLLFDTLHYAKLLEHGQIANADIHASALSQILGDNLYTKSEVDAMHEGIAREFSLLRNEIQRLEQDIQRLDQRLTKEIEKLRNEMYEEFKYYRSQLQNNFYATIGILGSLIVIVGALQHFFK